MKKVFTTLAFAVCILAVVPACAKKAKKQEVTVEQTQPVASTENTVKNGKEDFTV